MEDISRIVVPVRGYQAIMGELHEGCLGERKVRWGRRGETPLVQSDFSMLFDTGFADILCTSRRKSLGEVLTVPSHVRCTKVRQEWSFTGRVLSAKLPEVENHGQSIRTCISSMLQSNSRAGCSYQVTTSGGLLLAYRVMARITASLVLLFEAPPWGISCSPTTPSPARVPHAL